MGSVCGVLVSVSLHAAFERENSEDLKIRVSGEATDRFIDLAVYLKIRPVFPDSLLSIY